VLAVGDVGEEDGEVGISSGEMGNSERYKGSVKAHTASCSNWFCFALVWLGVEDAAVLDLRVHFMLSSCTSLAPHALWSC